MYACKSYNYSFDLLFFYMLGGHHHYYSNSLLVVAILSSYSYSSGNQLCVVGAIFSPMALLFSIAFWFSYLP